jgi:two-component system LytT family sensor kinase
VSFAVTNSGVGLQSTAQVSVDGHGVGLENVKNRLRLHYGENCSFKMSQIDRIHVKVAIVLPFQLSDEIESSITRYGAE